MIFIVYSLLQLLCRWASYRIRIPSSSEHPICTPEPSPRLWFSPAQVIHSTGQHHRHHRTRSYLTSLVDSTMMKRLKTKGDMWKTGSSCRGIVQRMVLSAPTTSRFTMKKAQNAPLPWHQWLSKKSVSQWHRRRPRETRQIS